MSIELLFFIFIQLVALIFFLEMLRRVHKRAMEYNLEETRETLPFGFVRLRHVVFFYILFYVFWLVFSLVMYFVFIGPHSVPFLNGNGVSGVGPTGLNL